MPVEPSADTQIKLPRVPPVEDSGALGRAYTRAAGVIATSGKNQRLGTPADNLDRLLQAYDTGEAARYPDLAEFEPYFVSYQPILTEMAKYMKIADNIQRAKSILAKPEVPDEERKRAEALIQTEKLKGAIVNQRFAQDHYVLLAYPDNEAQADALMLHGLAMALTKAEGYNQLGTNLLALLSGARAQAGLMHLLKINNYRVLAPETSKPKEVARWDLNGVDFAAVAPEGDMLLLVDAKGRSRYEFEEGYAIRREIPFFNDRPKRQDEKQRLLHAAIGADVAVALSDTHLDPTVPIRQVQILLPTSASHLDQIGKINPDIAKEVIQFLLRLESAPVIYYGQAGRTTR